MLKICHMPKYTQNMPKIFPRYAKISKTLMTHWLTEWIQEMLQHLKIRSYILERTDIKLFQKPFCAFEVRLNVTWQCVNSWRQNSICLWWIKLRNESAPQSVCSYSSFLFDTVLLLLPQRLFEFSARRQRFAITWPLSVRHLKWNENDELEAFSRLETNIEQWETSSNKSQKYFLGRKSSSITFVKSVPTHFLTNKSIFLIRHRQNRDSGFFFLATL